MKGEQSFDMRSFRKATARLILPTFRKCWWIGQQVSINDNDWDQSPTISGDERCCLVTLMVSNKVPITSRLYPIAQLLVPLSLQLPTISLPISENPVLCFIFSRTQKSRANSRSPTIQWQLLDATWWFRHGVPCCPWCPWSRRGENSADACSRSLEVQQRQWEWLSDGYLMGILWLFDTFCEIWWVVLDGLLSAIMGSNIEFTTGNWLWSMYIRNQPWCAWQSPWWMYVISQADRWGAMEFGDNECQGWKHRFHHWRGFPFPFRNHGRYGWVCNGGIDNTFFDG